MKEFEDHCEDDYRVPCVMVLGTENEKVVEFNARGLGICSSSLNYAEQQVLARRLRDAALILSPPLPCSEPIARKAKLLTRDCIPGDFVTWSDVQGWTFTGELKEWDNGTALIMWPMIQTPLIAVQA